jgi:hypothetical protein
VNALRQDLGVAARRRTPPSCRLRQSRSVRKSLCGRRINYDRGPLADLADRLDELARREARRAPHRALGSGLYNLEARVCFGLRCRDVNGTPKVFSRALYRAAQPRATGDLLDLELMVQAYRLGVPVEEIPVRAIRRHGGRSSTNLASAWGMYSGALRFWLTGAA